MNNKSKNNNWGNYKSNGGQKNNYNNNKSNKENFDLIKEPLHMHYKDLSKMLLPDGVAYEKAKDFLRIPSHQIRKILNQVKICSANIEKPNYDFEKEKNNLFALVPLSAYNAGRDEKLKGLYKFLASHLNNESIKDKSDIEMFDKLFTSIVAYHKYLGGK